MRTVPLLALVVALGGGACIRSNLDLSQSTTPTPGPTPPGWWNGSWKYRRPIEITAGSSAVPGAYSLPVTVDHASLVAAGKSLASGDDLVVIIDNGSELNRVLDSGAEMDTATTTLWFASSAGLPAGGAVGYWLYYGNPQAAAPPADGTKVFLLSDGFENGLGNWNVGSGWSVTTAQAHHGQHSAAAASVSNGLETLQTPGSLFNIDDIVFDAWWMVDSTSGGINIHQDIRWDSTHGYYTQCSDAFALGKEYNANDFVLVPPPNAGATLPAGVWVRVTVYGFGATMAVDVNGAPYLPAGTGFEPVGFDTAGGVGFAVHSIPSNAWFDDATARILVEPEPAVALGAEQAL